MYYRSISNFQREFVKREEIKLLIFIGEETPKEEIVNAFSFLDKMGVEYMGGIFPAVIYKADFYKSGFLIKQIHKVEFSGIFPLNSQNVVLPLLDNKNLSSLVIIDGLSHYIKDFLKLLFANYTDTIKYFGGGSGSMKLDQKPSIFYNGRLYQDSALVVLFSAEAEVYIEHGWEIMEGPYVTTAANENILEEINWRNALQFYQEVIYDNTGQELTKDNFFDIIKGFPLGIETDEGSIIVRDLLSIVDDERILCVSDIPNHSTIYILQGNKDSLLRSSQMLALNSSKSNTIMFDCASRALFLEKDFTIELSNMADKTSNDVFGALTLGEIASTRRGRLEFLNKTLVYCEFD